MSVIKIKKLSKLALFVIILILSHVVVVVPVSLLPISIVGVLLVLSYSYRPDR